MAIPPCFWLAADVFPKVRQEASRRLVDEGWSQPRIAEALHVSQAMVSRYSRAARVHDPLALRLVDALLEDLDAQGAGTSAWCQVLAPVPADEGILRDLLAAEALLIHAAPTRLVPQVGLNIAVCADDATGPEHVLSYPGRLVHAGGRIVPPVPPAFGASGHLASCLLAARRRDPAIHAIANIRGGAAMARLLTGPGTATLPGGEDDRVAQIEALPGMGEYIVDPGGFGIEPCVYVLGRDAEAVAEAIVALDRQL